LPIPGAVHTALVRSKGVIRGEVKFCRADDLAAIYEDWPAGSGIGGCEDVDLF